MGFTIMESFMDSVKVRSHPGKGTTVTMAQAIRHPGGRVRVIAPDTVTLIQAAQAGDKEACGRLVEENLGLIWSIVKRYTRKTVDNDDLYQLGCPGLSKSGAGV